MATREEIFVMLRSNNFKQARNGLYKAKLYDPELYKYCMRLMELMGYSIKDFIWAMDSQRGIGPSLEGERLRVVKAENLEDINSFLGIKLDIRTIQVNETQSINHLRVNYDNGKNPVEAKLI